MVVGFIERFWKGTKFTAETIGGMTRVFFSPNEPIPPPKLHSRMGPTVTFPGQVVIL